MPKAPEEAIGKHGGKTLALCRSSSLEGKPYTYKDSYGGVGFDSVFYHIRVGGSPIGHVMVGHKVELRDGKATIITDLLVDPEGEGIGYKVLEHFIKGARESGMKKVVLKEVSEMSGMFHGKKYGDVNPLRLESILSKIKGIKWEKVREGEKRHYVVEL
ncbi:MAG: GNAT family N-acetyltransferase [Candidatus Diapherotrites archaeon]|nr:GNAT family N-acetyltransferase [Candidatus Diapherotrites archaeon]